MPLLADSTTPGLGVGGSTRRCSVPLPRCASIYPQARRAANRKIRRRAALTTSSLDHHHFSMKQTFRHLGDCHKLISFSFELVRIGGAALSDRQLLTHTLELAPSMNALSQLFTELALQLRRLAMRCETHIHVRELVSGVCTFNTPAVRRDLSIYAAYARFRPTGKFFGVVERGRVSRSAGPLTAPDRVPRCGVSGQLVVICRKLEDMRRFRGARIGLIHAAFGDVAAREDDPIVHLEQHGTHQPQQRVVVGEDLGDIDPALDLAPTPTPMPSSVIQSGRGGPIALRSRRPSSGRERPG